MTGREYLKHYDKPDGTNSLYEGLKKNHGWYYKSKPEIKFEEILEKINIDYRYNFFTQHSQFDFLVIGKNINFIFEIDGDY